MGIKIVDPSKGGHQPTTDLDIEGSGKEGGKENLLGEPKRHINSYDEMIKISTKIQKVSYKAKCSV